jgi:hypothetical protein
VLAKPIQLLFVLAKPIQTYGSVSWTKGWIATLVVPMMTLFVSNRMVY